VGVAQGFRFLTPGLIGIFSALALKEIPHPAQWLGMLVVSLGLALLVGPGVRPVSAWVALGGLSAATLTAGALTALRSASRLHSPHQIVRFFLIFLALVGLSTYDARWCLPTSAQWPALVGMGLAGYWGQFYLSHSFELLSAPVAGTIGLCSLVWGVAFESLLTDYFPKPTELGAYAILLVGATILVHYERPRKD
jgi:drug/metabolite transporter (DMT)-like permease